MDREPLTTDSDFLAIWKTVNNAGYGYAIGNDGDTLADAAWNGGLDIIVEPESDDGIVVAMDRAGNIIGVGDSNGPWACKLGRMGE